MRSRAFAFWLLALAVVVGLGAAALVARLTAAPDTPTILHPPDLSAGVRAQQHIAELFLRERGLSARTDPIVVPTPELNAFLARHVEGRRLVLRPLVVRAEDGWLEVAGRTSLRRTLARPGHRGPLALLPDSILDLEFWMAVRGHVEARGDYGELVLEGASIGRQPVPVAWLWPILGVSPSELLRWRMPRTVERLEVQPGRLVVHTRRRAGRDGGASSRLPPAS